MSPLPSSSLWLLLLSMMPYGVGVPSGQPTSTVLAVSLPTSSCTPSLLTGGVRSRKGPWCCVNTAQQWLNQECVNNAASVANPKNPPHELLWRTTDCSAKPSTTRLCVTFHSSGECYAISSVSYSPCALIADCTWVPSETFRPALRMGIK